MDTHTCTQHGCEIEADEHPETCPVCNNPQNIEVANNEPEWDDLTKDELIEQLESWGVTEGWNSRSTKDELIECLELEELAQADNGDD